MGSRWISDVHRRQLLQRARLHVPAGPFLGGCKGNEGRNVRVQGVPIGFQFGNYQKGV